jgi:hypothetical protein
MVTHVKSGNAPSCPDQFELNDRDITDRDDHSQTCEVLGLDAGCLDLYRSHHELNTVSL